MTTNKSQPKRSLLILKNKEQDKKAIEKLKEYGKLLMKKNNRKQRHKLLRELKETAKKLVEPVI